MTWGEALAAMAEGKHVLRVAWGTLTYTRVFSSGGHLQRQRVGGAVEFYVPVEADKTATDWQVLTGG